MRALILMVTAAALIFAPPFVWARSAPPKTAAKTAEPKAQAWWLEVDGAVVTASGERKKLAPASLTKMMTVLVALERAGLEDTVKVGKAVEAETGHRIGLKNGDELRVADLAAAAVIASANDAARALAEHVAGSEEGFARLMNEKATALGLADTRFENASGHDSPGHYSSARDLAILGNEAMKNPNYAWFASRVALEIKTKAGRAFRLENKNELIGRYDGAIGVKSGTTPKAGKSVVALAERGGRRVLLVLLGAKERWFQAEALLDRGFAQASLQKADGGAKAK